MNLDVSAFYLTVIVIIAIVAIKDDASGNRTGEIAKKAIEAVKSLVTKQ